MRLLNKKTVKSKNSRTSQTRGLSLETLESRSLMAADVFYGPVSMPSCAQATIEQTSAMYSAQDQLLIELINRARANPAAEAAGLKMDLNNDLSSENRISGDAKQPLAVDQALMMAAELHSKNMIDTGCFCHINADGLSPTDRAKLQGYTGLVGENIAYRGGYQEDASNAVYASHEQLFRSAGHRINMLNDKYVEIGVGVEKGAWKNIAGGMETTMTTEKFGFSNSSSFPAITGVAYTDSVVNDDFYSIGEGISGLVVEARSEAGTIYSTKTNNAGGYSLRVPSGNYSLSVHNGTGETRSLGDVVVDAKNIKIDIATDKMPLVVPVKSSQPTVPSTAQPIVEAPSQPVVKDATPPVSNTPPKVVSEVPSNSGITGEHNSEASQETINSTVKQEQLKRFDTDQDGSVLPKDVLNIINHLVRRSDFDPKLDIDGDGRVSPMDALSIINFLSKNSEPSNQLPETPALNENSKTVPSESLKGSSEKGMDSRNDEVYADLTWVEDLKKRR